MANEAIQIWLTSSREYEAGLALFRAHGAGGMLLKILESGPTPYNRERLVKELQLLVQPAPTLVTVVTPVVPVAVPGRPTVKSPTPVPVPASEQLGAASRIALDQQWKSLYKRASFLHSQLHHVDQPARQAYALEILALEDQVRAIHAQKDYLAKYGTLPDTAKVPVPLTEKVDILKRIKNLATQISKQKNNPKRANEVARWKAEKLELEKLL